MLSLSCSRRSFNDFIIKSPLDGLPPFLPVWSRFASPNTGTSDFLPQSNFGYVMRNIIFFFPLAIRVRWLVMVHINGALMD